MIRIWEQLQFLRPGWTDLVEILIVAFLMYRILVVIQRTRAMQILLGVVLLASVYGLARLLDLILVRTLLEAGFQYGAIAALVVFQPELRAALARLGRNRMIRAFQRLEGTRVVEEVIDATERLARARHGAIIALEQKASLEEYAMTGSAVDAPVSAEMLVTIFTPYSPLHDGAVLIAGDRIRCAGAILPLTQSPVKDRSLGTRHRAALGLSEETDAIVIVVSEESSQVAVAHGGTLERDVSSDRLRAIVSGVVTEERLAAEATVLSAGEDEAFSSR
ncbi:MAG: TIGR00159 family protein [Gemmatimonadetes bacterium]|nr:TIGR00159 family protein [Gemmatimonadota bacterium]